MYKKSTTHRHLFHTRATFTNKGGPCMKQVPVQLPLQASYFSMLQEEYITTNTTSEMMIQFIYDNIFFLLWNEYNQMTFLKQFI